MSDPAAVLVYVLDNGLPVVTLDAAAYCAEAEWHKNFDVAVLAIYMSVPKEGPSAGVAILTGIGSALKGVPVRHDIP